VARGKSGAGHLVAVGDALAIAVASAASDDTPKVIQLFKMGAHPSRNGKPKIVRVDDLAHAERIAAATAGYHRCNDMVIDYDHQSIFAAKDGVGGQARAAGWSGKVFATDEGVFAEVDWNEAAASAIDSKEYRYISPVFVHDKDGRPVFVVNATLTNTPSLDLLPAAASALSQLIGDESMNYGPIAKALGLGEDASEEEILRAIANMNSAPAAMTALATVLGASEGADLVAVATALKDKADNAASPDPSKFVPVATVAALQTSVQSLQGTVDDLKSKERKQKIDAAQAAGSLPPALVAHATAIDDDAKLDAFLGALPTSGLGKASVEGEPEASAGNLSATQLAVCSAMGLSEEEFLAAQATENGGSK